MSDENAWGDTHLEAEQLQEIHAEVIQGEDIDLLNPDKDTVPGQYKTSQKEALDMQNMQHM